MYGMMDLGTEESADPIEPKDILGELINIQRSFRLHS